MKNITVIILIMFVTSCNVLINKKGLRKEVLLYNSIHVTDCFDSNSTKLSYLKYDQKITVYYYKQYVFLHEFINSKQAFEYNSRDTIIKQFIHNYSIKEKNTNKEYIFWDAWQKFGNSKGETNIIGISNKKLFQLSNGKSGKITINPVYDIGDTSSTYVKIIKQRKRKVIAKIYYRHCSRGYTYATVQWSKHSKQALLNSKLDTVLGMKIQGYKSYLSYLYENKNTMINNKLKINNGSFSRTERDKMIDFFRYVDTAMFNK